MEAKVKKRLETCLILWSIFVLLKWIMLLGPSSILSKLSPLMIILQDGKTHDYNISGFVSLGIETALVGVFFLIKSKKINILYLLCTLYSLLYFPAIVYWIVSMEFELWRYFQFLPALCCCIFMIMGCYNYIKQPKLVRPKEKKEKEEIEKTQED